MRKLKYNFTRKALIQIYLSYVRPLLEYSCVVWDCCTADQSHSLEKLQHEAARIVAGLTRSVTLERLYRECGWKSLQSRRSNQKLRFMYRTMNDMGPSYMSNLIPPTAGNRSQCNIRDLNNIAMHEVRTSTFVRSCIPSAINLCNNLDLVIRQLFLLCLKTTATQEEVTQYYMNGNRKLNAIHLCWDTCKPLMGKSIWSQRGYKKSEHNCGLILSF